MKNMLICANWKSNKTKTEAKIWLDRVSLLKSADNIEIVIFPPFTLLDLLSSYVKVNSLPFKIGAQDLSPFEAGAYTGEISAVQIKEFADYVLIGHSERRSNFGESDEMVRSKVEKAIEAALIPIVCISDLKQAEGLSQNQTIFAYEPISAIGTGNPEDSSAVEEVAKQIRSRFGGKVIYGGSVNAENCEAYLSLENISGALVGGASLDPDSFTEIIKNAV